MVPTPKLCMPTSAISSGVFRDFFSSDMLFLEFLRLRGFRLVSASQLPFGTKVVHSFDFESRYSMVFKNVFPIRNRILNHKFKKKKPHNFDWNKYTHLRIHRRHTADPPPLPLLHWLWASSWRAPWSTSASAHQIFRWSWENVSRLSRQRRTVCYWRRQFRSPAWRWWWALRAAKCSHRGCIPPRNSGSSRRRNPQWHRPVCCRPSRRPDNDLKISFFFINNLHFHVEVN